MPCSLLMFLLTYFNWNSAEASAMNHRWRSSVDWLNNFAVWGPSTPSRCDLTMSWAGGSEPLAWARTVVTKLTRSTTVVDEIHASLVGQPLTSGGSNSDWPSFGPEPSMAFDTLLNPSARAEWAMNSVGVFTKLR